jgi:hypothetical protein
MTRDLIDYQAQYAQQPYEKYQVAFRKRKMNDILAKYPHARMLEVGCGLESIFLAVNSFEQLTVIEPAEMFYEKALSDAAQFPEKAIKVINALLEETKAEDHKNGYDFIFVSCLLHEIPNQERFLKGILDLCDEHTTVHINVPNAYSFHRLLAVEMGLIPTAFEPSSSNIQFQQHQIFDSVTLRQVVENQGFEIIEEGSYSFKPFTHGQMQKMIDANLLTMEMLDGFYKMERFLPNMGSEIYVNLKKK